MMCTYYFKGVPVISPEVISQAKYEKDRALIICQAAGKPIPSIIWFFNSAPVDKNNFMISETLLNPVTKLSTLEITSLALSDMGAYTCNAVNQVSSNRSSGVLTVNRKCSTALSL